MEEELGIVVEEPEFLYTYIHTNSYETELVYTYSCLYEGSLICFNPVEIDEIKFWSVEEINEHMGKRILSENFEQEILNYVRFMENRGLEQKLK
jgi:NADH pyrophosphatase NudC (nudix superfamily)